MGWKLQHSCNITNIGWLSRPIYFQEETLWNWKITLLSREVEWIKKIGFFQCKKKIVPQTGIAKFFTKKIPRRGNKESISSTIFSPSNLTMWLFTLIQFVVGCLLLEFLLWHKILIIFFISVKRKIVQ